MKIYPLAATAALCVQLTCCSYQVQTVSAPQLDVYSNYEKKVPGKWALIVDPAQFNHTVKAEGVNCAAHNYPLDLRSSFKQSVAGTFENIVDSVEVVDGAAPAETLTSRGYAGVISVRAEDLRSRLIFEPGFFTSTADATIELDAGMTVYGPNGKLLGTRGTGKGDGNSDAGEFCGGTTNAIEHASEAAMKDLLGVLGERFTNAPQVRAATGRKEPATQ
ncbi:MAG TPA: hypothetical protein VHT03_04755 [Rhizomicrobium sp.]|jgi:hypothetical protein|nr:hypothetical protein [Rhizomicrobium sp.]